MWKAFYWEEEKGLVGVFQDTFFFLICHVVLGK